MKKTMVFLCCLLLWITLLGCAAAEIETVPLPKEQIDYIVPSGLNAEITVEDGLLRIAVNDDSTDWAAAVANTGGNGSVQIIAQVTVPSGVEAGDHLIFIQKDPSDDEWSAEEIFTLEEQHNRHAYISKIDSWNVAARQDGMPLSERGIEIARAITEMSYLVPAEEDFTYYVRWYDENKQPMDDLKVQTLRVQITHSRTEAFRTKVVYPVSAERIHGNINNAAGVSVLEKKESYINYCAAQAGTMFDTGVEAPTGATSYTTMANLKAGGITTPQPLTNGMAVLSTTRHSDMDAVSGTKTIFFCDENQNVVETVSVCISYQSAAEMLVWPAYEDAMYVMPADQLVIENGAANAGFTVSYNEETGELRTGYDGTMRRGSAMGELALTVKVPEWGASAYRWYQHSSNHVLGPTAGSFDTMLLDMDRSWPDGPNPVTSDTAYNEHAIPFEVISPDDDSITIYLPDRSADIQHFAHLFVFEWLTEDGPEYSYFWKTIEPFTIVETSIPVTSVRDLEKPVSKPHVVGPNGKPFQNWKLLITCYFTESANAWQYDLQLVDANGNPVRNDNPIRVYLPYPEGHAYGDKNKVYKLNHYTDGLYKGLDLDAAESLEVTATEYGLMFETSTFSPFILSCTDTTPDPEDFEHLRLSTVMPDGMAAVPDKITRIFSEVRTWNELEVKLADHMRTKLSGLANTELHTSLLNVTLEQYDTVSAMWLPVSGEDFPEEGITVVLPYPEGSNRWIHEFHVSHLFTENCNGFRAGAIEYPTPVLTIDGIQIRLMGTSPVLIAWKEKSASSQNTALPPKTGDSTPLLALGVLLVLSAAGIVLLYRRKHA